MDVLALAIRRAAREQRAAELGREARSTVDPDDRHELAAEALQCFAAAAALMERVV